MKKPILFCLFVWSLIAPLAAQITVTNAVFPSVGDTLHYAFGNQPGAINQIFTPPGGGQHWDLSNLQPTQYWKQITQSPQTGMAAAAFPSATMWYHPLNSSSEVYLQVTGTQVKDLGYFGLDPLGLGLKLLFRKLPGLEESWAPVNFFDIKQSSANVLTAFAASSAPPILLNLAPTADSFRIRLTYQRIAAVDAYGALSIPGGTFEVLRKKQTEYKSTAVDVKVAPLGWIDISTIGGQQVLPLGTDTITTFHFLNDVSKEPIAICTLNTQQNMVTGVQYKAVNPPVATFTPGLQEELFTYPNPVRNSLHVHLSEGTGMPFQVKLMDVQGKSVLEQTIMTSNGAPDISISVADLAPGIYTLLLQRNGVKLGQARVVKI